MKALGVTDHRYLGGFKRYRDSGMQWHESATRSRPTTSTRTPSGTPTSPRRPTYLVEMIREVRPQVLVTYDEFGGYGHPDHIQAHRVATYAAVAGRRAVLPSRPRARPTTSPRSTGAAMSASRVRQGLRDLRAAGDTTTFEGMDPDADLPAFMVEDEDLTHARRRRRLRRRPRWTRCGRTAPRSRSTARSSRSPTTRATRSGARSSSASPRAPWDRPARAASRRPLRRTGLTPLPVPS